MNRYWTSSVILTFILTTVVTGAHATDEALLQVLRNNKLITEEQYEAIKKSEGQKQPPAETAPVKRPPTREEGLLEVLLANGLITQEQYAALQVKNAVDKGKRQETREARVTMVDRSEERRVGKECRL